MSPIIFSKAKSSGGSGSSSNVSVWTQVKDLSVQILTIAFSVSIVD